VREARYMRLISWTRHRGSEQYGMCRVGQSIVDYFFGSLLSPIEGCEGQEEQNLLGSSPRNGVNGGMGVGRPSVNMEIACHKLIDQSSMRYSNIGRFERTSATAKTWFSM
jgi:hypothetical protein